MTEEWQSSVLASVSKCPSCGGELEKGYAIADVIWFDTQKKRIVRSGGDRYALTKWHWGVATLPALRCVKCEITIFDYSEG